MKSEKNAPGLTIQAIAYASCKVICVGFFMLALVTPALSQVAPIQDQIQFVTALGTRIRGNTTAELVRMRTQQLDPAIASENQAELTRNSLFQQRSVLAGRIERLNWLLREYPRIRGTMDRVSVQQVNFLRDQITQSNRQAAALDTQLTAANVALKAARERRLQVEREIASKQGVGKQLDADLIYLYNTWQRNPSQYSWEAIRDRFTEIAHGKQLTSSVTVSTGALVPLTVKYQLVSGGQTYSAMCTRCVITPLVGNYNLWIDNNGSATTPQRLAYLISQERHSIDISGIRRN